MTLDADEYRINIPFIKEMTKNLTDKERYDFVSELAVVTGVPIIIICIYLTELYGHTVELDAFANRMKLFYNVSEIKRER